MLLGALTVGANADNSQQMLRDFKAVLGGHGVLKSLQFSRKEFDDLAALGTDHVVVMLVFVVVFVVRASVAETNFTSEPRFSEQLKGAINRRLADRWVFFFDELVEIFVREMVFGAQKNIQNEVALRRALEPSFLDVFKKDFLFFG